MSENKISLSQYFVESQTPYPTANQPNFSIELSDATKNLEALKLGDSHKTENKSEPAVCRLFSDSSVQPKDPTAAFFDLITGNPAAGATSNVGIPTGNEDFGFEARLAVGTDAERRRNAWIPNEKTRQILISCATSPPGTYIPDKEYLTMPGVILEEELSDTVGEAVTVCLGEAEAAERRIITADDVTQDERGLRELVQAGAYRAAINLTSRLLTIYGQGKGRLGHPTKHSPHSLQLWFTRIALLVKIRLFSAAQAEGETFGQLEKPDVYFQFYPEMYGNRPGSIASFSFRLLLAELPMHCGKSKESLTKLFNLWSTVKQILKNLDKGLCEDGNPMELSDSDRSDSVRLWKGREERIMHSIINCAIFLEHFELAMDLLGQLCERDEAHRHILLSALGRLHLQTGNTAGAEACFEEAKELRGEVQSLRELVDRGLLCMSKNNIDEAFHNFQQATSLEPNNLMVLNNMSVCLLYGGRLKEAISILESAIAANPPHALHESLLLNLCTLYDMESSKGRMKKFALLRQISRYQADAPTMILEKLYG